MILHITLDNDNINFLRLTDPSFWFSKYILSTFLVEEEEGTLLQDIYVEWNDKLFYKECN